jgi:hypothetical protein
MMVAFTAELELHGRTATGIAVPESVVAALGGGRRPAVAVAFHGYSYRTTLGVMDGRSMIPVSAEHRAAAGVAAGDLLDVDLVLDDAPRVVEVPPELAQALRENPAAGRAFDALSPSARKRHVLAITGAKTDATRDRRLASIIDELAEAAP